MTSESRSNVIQVDHLVSLARRVAPLELEKLAREYPDEKMLFEPGATLGDGAPTRAAIDAALLGLESFSSQADEVLEVVRQRLSVLRILELISKVVSAAGAAAALGALLKGYVSQATLAATFSLLGTLASLLTSWLGGGIAGQQGSLVSDFDILVNKLVSAQSLSRKIRAAKRSKSPDSEITDLVKQGDTLAEDLNRFVLRYRTRS